MARARDNNLDHCSELGDVKRVMLNPHAISKEFLINYFGKVSTGNGLACIDAVLAHNIRQNFTVVVKITAKHTEQMTVEALIAIFEKFKSVDGLCCCLGAVLNFSQEPDVRALQAHRGCLEAGTVKEVERVCRDSTVYDAKQVKEFLMDAKLVGPRPLIHVCDRYGFVEELAADRAPLL